LRFEAQQIIKIIFAQQHFKKRRPQTTVDISMEHWLRRVRSTQFYWMYEFWCKKHNIQWRSE